MENDFVRVLYRYPLCMLRDYKEVCGPKMAVREIGLLNHAISRLVSMRVRY